MNAKSIEKYITPLDTVVTADADKTLGAVLPRVQSSHSPIFVFSKENTFVGLVSTHQALYTHRYSYTTKLASIARMPPYITKETPLYVVAGYMLEGRVYILPVFNTDKQIIGVIHAKDIFQNLIADKDFINFSGLAIQPQKPITAQTSATVGDIFQLMKDKQVSRVIMVDEIGALAGIVSRKDLHNIFLKPTKKQRFGKNGMRHTDRAFDEEKDYRKDDLVKGYFTEFVFTLPSDTEHNKLITKLIASGYNSVVLINTHNKPVGFVSLHDILVGIASLKPEETVNLRMTRPTSNVSEAEVQEAEDILTKFGLKMSKRIAIDKIEVTFEEPKSTVGESILFNTALILSPVVGTKMISKTKNRSFIEGIHEAISQIEKQQRRSNKTN